MSNPLDAVEGVLWQAASAEVCELLEVLETGDLTALEMAGLLTILRGAKSRLDGEPTMAPVLQMVAI